MPIQTPEKIVIPEPGTDDWHTYGQRLNVPGVDPYQEIGSVHLWYLIDDVQVLHRLLQHGIDQWGQLQSLVDYGQVEWLVKETTIFEKVSAAANILRRAIECWRIGRGRPVDYETLINSDCVSPTFIDAIIELSEQVGRNARKLIDELENGSVKNFRTQKRMELEEYLKTHGYLDRSEVLTPEQVLEMVRPIAFDYLDRELFDARRMEELVYFVTRIDECDEVDAHEADPAEDTS